MFIIINAANDKTMPQIALTISRSRNATADITDERISPPPCDSGYSCADGKYFAAQVLKYEFKNKHTDIMNTYFSIGFMFIASSLSDFALKNAKQAISNIAEKRYVYKLKTAIGTSFVRLTKSFCEKSESPFEMPQNNKIMKAETVIFCFIVLLYEHIMPTAAIKITIPIIAFTPTGSPKKTAHPIIGISTPSIQNTSSIIYEPFLADTNHNTTNAEFANPDKRVTRSTVIFV